MENINEEKEKEKKQNLIKEDLINLTNSITNYFAQELQDYLSLITFFEQVCTQFQEISSKVKLPKNFNSSNPDYLSLKSFYNFHSLFLNNIREIPEKINSDVLSTLKNFKEEFEFDNKNIFFSLNSIIEEISSQENLLNKTKKELDEEKTKNKDYKNSSKYNAYKKEIENKNKLYSDIEKKFNDIRKNFEENESKKNKIISNCIYIYFKMIHEDLDSVDNINGEIKKLINQYKSRDWKKSFNDIFPNLKILNLKYWGGDDKIQKNSEENNKVKQKTKKKEEKTTGNTFFNEFYIPSIVIQNNIIGIDDEFMVLKSQDQKNQTNFVDITEDEEKIKDNIIINNFLYGLDNLSQQNEISLNIEDVFGRNIGNKNFYIEFCDKIIKAKGEKKTLYEFKNFSYLVYLTNILNLILENITDDLFSNEMHKEYFVAYKILDKIICIGEKSVNDETYMCSLLGKNKIFKNKNIWINSIKNKIINLLNELCTKEYKSKSKDSVFRPAKFIQNNIKNTQLGKLFGKIEGIIGDKKKNLIELCGFNKSIEDYYKLSKEQKNNIDENALSIFHGVIKCYIRHITNYNFTLENTTDIISLICNILNIKDEEHIIFYCYYYQDCVYTSKKINRKNKSSITPEIKEKIKYIKSGNKNKKIPQKYAFDLNNKENKYFIIKKASKYLEDEEKLKLLCLSKYYEKLRTYIYKSFLKKDISLQRRLHLWKSYLKYNRTISLYDYKEILKETETEFFKKANEKSIIQIEKDMNRTYLRKRNDNSAKQLFNILISFVNSEQKINYVQGINGIAGFIYDLTENEEETFHLLISIFVMTQLRDIYEDDEFHKLKSLFYSIERLVYLFLPKIYSKLKDNNIELGFFMSSQFITLYTILYPSLPEDDISFLLHLWDDFFLNGWSSFFSSWLAILKFHESDILSLNNEKLIDFVTNKIKKSELFKKENYNKFCEFKKKFKISEELIKNLQDEIGVEAGIRKVGVSSIIEDFNTDDKIIDNKKYKY